MKFFQMIRLADDFGSSTIATGTSQLLSDVGNWLIGICLAAGTTAAVYFLIRRAFADEQEGKLWTRRCIVSIICAVAGALVGSIVSMIGSYYITA